MPRERERESRYPHLPAEEHLAHVLAKAGTVVAIVHFGLVQMQNLLQPIPHSSPTHGLLSIFFSLVVSDSHRCQQSRASHAPRHMQRKLLLPQQ